MADQRSEEFVKLLSSDVNSLSSLLGELTDSYRLLVIAAAELSRIPGAGQLTVNRAIDRADNTGNLLDWIILVLALKLDFVLDVLVATQVPLELILSLILATGQVKRDPANLLSGPSGEWRAKIDGKLENDQINNLETELNDDVEERSKFHMAWDQHSRKWMLRQQQACHLMGKKR